MITVSIFQDCVHAAALERRRFQRLKKAVPGGIEGGGERHSDPRRNG